MSDQPFTARTEMVEITGVCDRGIDEHSEHAKTMIRDEEGRTWWACHCGSKGFWL